MKFSEIKRDEWGELKPYLDTCLLPLTGLTGDQAPWQVTAALEQLRDLMDHVELPFKGRLVTYPAMHYSENAQTFVSAVDRLCSQIKTGGFKYVVLITARPEIAAMNFRDADLLIGPEHSPGKEKESFDSVISVKIQDLWRSERTGDEM